MDKEGLPIPDDRIDGIVTAIKSLDPMKNDISTSKTSTSNDDISTNRLDSNKNNDPKSNDSMTKNTNLALNTSTIKDKKPIQKLNVNNNAEEEQHQEQLDDPTAFWLAWSERRNFCENEIAEDGKHISSCTCFEGLGSVM
mmetsp:Transcript_17710/g.21657  ORF Transcript_17710/g.21657 Transcript_17710/m.21657 type:complete len:140 (+) Transcript_17710:231-650(+)